MTCEREVEVEDYVIDDSHDRQIQHLKSDYMINVR